MLAKNTMSCECGILCRHLIVFISLDCESNSLCTNSVVEKLCINYAVDILLLCAGLQFEFELLDQN